MSQDILVTLCLVQIVGKGLDKLHLLHCLRLVALADFLALTFAMDVFFQLLYVKSFLPDERLYMFLGTLVFGE